MYSSSYLTPCCVCTVYCIHLYIDQQLSFVWPVWMFLLWIFNEKFANLQWSESRFFLKRMSCWLLHCTAIVMKLLLRHENRSLLAPVLSEVDLECNEDISFYLAYGPAVWCSYLIWVLWDEQLREERHRCMEKVDVPVAQSLKWTVLPWAINSHVANWSI